METGRIYRIYVPIRALEEGSIYFTRDRTTLMSQLGKLACEGSWAPCTSSPDLQKFTWWYVSFNLEFSSPHRVA
jgi:hypothetical protein